MSTTVEESDEVLAAREKTAVNLLAQTMEYAFQAALRAAAEVKVADYLADGPKTPQELGRATQTEPEQLHRILRVLATRDVFRETKDGRFELTEAADQLRSDVPFSLRHAILMLTDPTIWDGLNRLADKLKGRPPFRAAHGKSFWEYWAERPTVDTFDVGMASMSRPENAILRRHYTFPAQGTVVDVAGGRGQFLRDVLKENPGLTGILFEQEHVLKRNALADIDDSRYELVAGDFFESVPAGDLYLLRHIPHDWGHHDAVRILKNVRRAMKPGARVLVMDPVIPPGNTWHGGKTMDLICMAIYDEGHERDESEMKRMLADSGLRVQRTIPCGFYVSITEAVAA